MSPTRRAITLVEVLVVLAVIGILMAILAPAVQQAREAARRVDCTNRLHQLGLALHNYESSHRVCPPGAALGGWSWRTMILPMMDQGATYNLIDFANNIDPGSGFYTCGLEAMSLYNQHPDWENHLGRSFHCPSDPVSHPQLTNYVGVAGNAQPLDWQFARDYRPGDALESPGNGMFFLCSAVSLAQATDGASTTLFVGERGQHQFGHTNNLCCFSRGERDAWMSVIGGLRPGSFEGSDHWTHYWSYHYGGTQFLFVDGHVSLLSYSMDRSVFFALGSRNGGELTPGF